MSKCTKCKEREATENMKTCQSCRTIQARRGRESKKRKLERTPKEGHKLCTTCYCDVPITDAFTTCVKCREKSKRRKERKRLEMQKKKIPDGMKRCTRCFKMLFTSSKEKYKTCEQCREKQQLIIKRVRAKAEQNVLPEGMKRCTQCHSSFPSCNFKTCTNCRKRVMVYSRKRKAATLEIPLPKGTKRCTRCYRSFPLCKFNICCSCRKKRRAREKKRKQKALQKNTEKDGHRVCYHCLKEKPTKEFQSTVFRRKKLTSNCVSCRRVISVFKRRENSKLGQCKKLWEDWKTSHCCENCGTKECIEADHIDRSKKIACCSHYDFWAYHGGVEALQKELLKCRPLCRFCHKLHTSKQQGRDDQVWRVKKRNYVNNIKMKIGSCELCDRKVENESMCCAFDFDHLDVETKRDCISKMVGHYRLADFFECIDAEVAKCRLLCANCHKKHTKEQQRKASVVSMID